MSSRPLPPPPPPKPPRLQVKSYRQPIPLPKEAMESTEYLDKQQKIISKHVDIDPSQDDERKHNSSLLRAEPAQVSNDSQSLLEIPDEQEDDLLAVSAQVPADNDNDSDDEMQMDSDNDAEHNEHLRPSTRDTDQENQVDQVDQANQEEQEDQDGEEIFYSDEEAELDEAEITAYLEANNITLHLESDQKSNQDENAVNEAQVTGDTQVPDDKPAGGSQSKSIGFEIEDAKLLDHLRMRNPELLPKLIKMHLLMLLDLNGDTFSSIFEENICVPEESKRLGTIKRRKHENKHQDKTIFQQALTEEGICRMYLLIDFIGKDSNIDQEGIFRKCGSNGRQQELKYKLQQQTHLALEGSEYTVHDCSNVLKACLSELPEPLLSERFYKLICQYGQLTLNSQAAIDSPSGARQLKIIQLILLLLPEQRKKFACDLLCLLQRVGSADNTHNRMDARNLATLFAPHLLCPKALQAADLQKAVPAMTGLLEFLITYAQQVFHAPDELLLDVRRALTVNIDDGDSDCVRTAYTFCQPQLKASASGSANQHKHVPVDQPQAATDDDRQGGKSFYTQKHVAELYAYVQQMPDSPHKRRLVKQFNRQNGGLTPQPDKENSKRKAPGPRIAIRMMGDKLRAMRDKVASGKGLLGGSRRAGSAHELDVKSQATTSHVSARDQFKTQEIANQSKASSMTRKLTNVGPNGRARSRSSDDLLDVWHPCEQSQEVREAPIDVPLEEMTTTRFCIDDDELEESPSNKQIHKKRVRAASADDILTDAPYTSESIIV